MCLEGSDCEKDASCAECSGVACTRITSFNLEDNREVALTCIPYDTRTFGRAHLEESGCRRVDDRQICDKSGPIYRPRRYERLGWHQGGIEPSIDGADTAELLTDCATPV
ncbi:hypothetical protein RB195_012798 [Necator americanus]|uniref:Uncharacterized protein n=1 Tax=Necator americanus TaxID=51031 RepID=A0ABR1DSK3_NECAM